MALGTVAVRVLRAHGLMAADRRGPNSNGTSDPYVVVQCTSGAKGKTTVRSLVSTPPLVGQGEDHGEEGHARTLTLTLTLTPNP